jgi:hypothetical protein
MIGMASVFLSCKKSVHGDDFKVTSYLSYNTETLPDDIGFANETNYDSLVLDVIDLVGLQGLDVDIVKINRFGAFSGINILTRRKYFLYSPEFFDSIKTVTKSLNPIRSVCFHELAHHFYEHPLKPSWGSYMYEKQADRYSGRQMAIINATLEESLAAMEHFGDTDDTTSHPSKKVRLADIRKGYIEAKVKVLKDTAYIKRYLMERTNEVLFAVANSFGSGVTKLEATAFHGDTTFALNEAFMESTSISKGSIEPFTPKIFDEENRKTIETDKFIKSITKAIPSRTYLLLGELFSVTSDNSIKRIASGQIVGKLLSTGNTYANKIIDIDGVRFYLNSDDIIFSIDPDGSQIEVGNRLK